MNAGTSNVSYSRFLFCSFDLLASENLPIGITDISFSAEYIIGSLPPDVFCQSGSNRFIDNNNKVTGCDSEVKPSDLSLDSGAKVTQAVYDTRNFVRNRKTAVLASVIVDAPYPDDILQGQPSKEIRIGARLFDDFNFYDLTPDISDKAVVTYTGGTKEVLSLL